MSANASVALLLGALLLMALALILTRTDDRQIVYCARGGHVLVVPDSKDQHYIVNCVRKRP